MQNQNELYHYGRLGMRWGHHKYRDRYGGLTQTGQIKVRQLAAEHRKLSNIGNITKQGQKRRLEVEALYEHLTGKSIGLHKSDVTVSGPRKVSEMTNEELTAYNTRKQLETTYQGFQPKPEISKGKKFAAAVGKHALAPMAKEIHKQIIMPKILEFIKTKTMSPEEIEKAAQAAAKAAQKAIK